MYRLTRGRNIQYTGHKWGYSQVEIDKRDLYKAVFTSHQGLYRIIRMPFGRKNAPGTFQRAVDVILTTEKMAVHRYLLGRHCRIFEGRRGTDGPFKKCIDSSSDGGLNTEVKKGNFVADNRLPRARDSTRETRDREPHC